MPVAYQQTVNAAVCSSPDSYGTGRPLNTERFVVQAIAGGTGGPGAAANIDASAADVLVLWFEITPAAGISWNAGDFTAPLDLGANSNITLESIRIARISSACVFQATMGAATGLAISCATAGVKAGSVTIATSAQAPAAGDRVIVMYGFSNAAASLQSIQIDATQLITAPFSVPATFPRVRPVHTLAARATYVVRRSYQPGSYYRKSLLTTSGSGAFTQALSGAITPTGALTMRVFRSVAGSMTPSGALVKETQRPLTGSIAPSATLARETRKPLSGAVAPSATLTRETRKLLTGAVAPSATLARETRKPLTGAVAPSGALESIRTFTLALSGAIAPTGILRGRAGKVSSGSITPSSELVRETRKRLEGAIAPAGSLTRRIARSLSGVIAPGGSLEAIRNALPAIAGYLRGTMRVVPVLNGSVRVYAAITGAVRAVHAITGRARVRPNEGDDA